MSGTGKSTVLSHLRERGYRAVDTDYGGWIDESPGAERGWREERIDALITEHERSGETLFIAGTVRNQTRFHRRFDQIVLLTAALEVLLDRVANRATNPFGHTAEERRKIAADKAEVEPLLRRSATVELDTQRPLTETVDYLAGLPGR